MEHHHEIRNILTYTVLLHGAPPSDKKQTDLHCTTTWSNHHQIRNILIYTVLLHGTTPSDKKHTDLHCTTTWNTTIR